MTLNVASNIHNQASVLSTVGMIHGNRKAARTSPLQRKVLFSTSARAMPNTSLSTVAMAVYTKVFWTVWVRWYCRRCV